MNTLEQLEFHNSFARLPEQFHSRIQPASLSRPYLVSFNSHACSLIGLSGGEVWREDFASYFAGNRLLPGSEPLAMLYAGHQFGNFVPQLGDGRAILLGEVKNAAGENWEIQLKGAGPTPYSRSGDGRAVLRSSIREYLCSEAMHGLDIPTTRALCIVGSDDEVYRETIESAAVVTRLSQSFVRFGSFEVFYHRGQHQQLRELAEYVIARHFPELAGDADKYAKFFQRVVESTARLMAQWQAVGFSHGVMNTDNMSIIGLTMDYGPFGFMEKYNSSYICNHSDRGGRYAFNQQPQVALWNLDILSQALSPLLSREVAENLLDTYGDIYSESYVTLMCRKMGIRYQGLQDYELIEPFLGMMQQSQLDYTNTFRALGKFSACSPIENDFLRDQFVDRAAFDRWAALYCDRLVFEGAGDAERKIQMDRVNPKYILRNYLAQVAISKAEKKDFSEVNNLLDLLKKPFAEQPEMEQYTQPAPDWATNLEVSCSS